MTLDEIYAILNNKIKKLQPSEGDKPTYDGESYSYQERAVGTWVDNKPLYEKTINFGPLPNNNTKSISHGISDVSVIWIHGGYAFDDDGFYELNVSSKSPNVPGNITTYDWRTSVTKESIIIETSKDKSLVSAVIILRYTKTTD